MPQRDPTDFGIAFETAFARLQVTILEACERERSWPRQAAAAVRAALELAAADPAAARTLTSEVLAHGSRGAARHERLVVYLGERLAPGRDQQSDGERLPDVTERATAGGVLALVANRVDRGKADELPALAPEAIQFVLTPYLGVEEARRIATETPPRGH